MNYICRKCKGRGYHSSKNEGRGFTKCIECSGTGKVDWIDNIFGAEKIENNTLLCNGRSYSKSFIQQMSKQIFYEIDYTIMASLIEESKRK